MNYLSSYSNGSVYKNDPYVIKENINSENTFVNSLKNVLKDNKIIALEVPQKSIPFTILCDKQSKTSDILVLTDSKIDIVESINLKFMDTLARIRTLHNKLNNIEFNLMGYFFLEDYNAGFCGDAIWFYDIFINDNWVDFPMVFKLLESVGLSSLPKVYYGDYDFDKLKSSLNSPSILNKSFNIEKMIVKSYLEPYGVSVRNSIGFFEKETVKTIPIQLPVSNSVPIPVSNPVSIVENKKEEDEIYKKVEDIFNVFFLSKEETLEKVKNTEVPITKENKTFIFMFVKNLFLTFIFEYWQSFDSINKIDVKKIEKAVGHHAFLYCKEHYNLFN